MESAKELKHSEANLNQNKYKGSAGSSGSWGQRTHAQAVTFCTRAISDMRRISGSLPYLILPVVMWFCSQPSLAHDHSSVKLKAIDELIGAGKYDEAIKQATSMEKMYPANLAELKADIATANMYRGDNEAARAAAVAAIKIDARNHEAHWVLANVYMSMGESEAGAKEYQLSLKFRSQKTCKPCAKKSKELLKRFKH